MFVVLGCFTVIVGLAMLLWIPDNPMTAKFLSDSEKAAVLHHVSINQTGIQNHHFKIKQVLELLLDPQIWLLMIMLALVSRHVFAYLHLGRSDLVQNSFAFHLVLSHCIQAHS